MYTLPADKMGKVVCIFAMGYLCVCHISRMYYDYGGYTLDITGLDCLDDYLLLKSW
jgi:lysophospholipid acyltransferase 1/2